MSAQYIAALWVVLVSVILFCMMGADKRFARRGERRIPEARLFFVAVLGGALGGWIGMRVFHHKTRHWYFAVGFPAIAIAQMAGVVWLFIGA